MRLTVPIGSVVDLNRRVDAFQHPAKDVARGAAQAVKLSLPTTRSCILQLPYKRRWKMVVATNWTSLGVSRFYNYLCACLHHIWFNSLTQLSRLISKISSTRSIFCWISRHSELVFAFADNRESQSEIPKAATEHDRWRALAKCNKYLLPVGITASLLALNFSTIFWVAPGGANQNARLNALEFAAKVHEILLVSSLSLIVLDHVQFELLRGGGVSIGGLLLASKW